MIYKGNTFKSVITKQIMGSSGAELGFKKKDESFIIWTAESSWIAEKWQECNQLLST